MFENERRVLNRCAACTLDSFSWRRKEHGSKFFFGVLLRIHGTLCATFVYPHVRLIYMLRLSDCMRMDIQWLQSTYACMWSHIRLWQIIWTIAASGLFWIMQNKACIAFKVTSEEHSIEQFVWYDTKTSPSRPSRMKFADFLTQSDRIRQHKLWPWSFTSSITLQHLEILL